jgi:cytoskeleton protein RodZ
VTPAIALGCAGVLLAAVWWVLAGSRPANTPPRAQSSPVVSGDDSPVSPLTPTLAATPAALDTSAIVPAAAVPVSPEPEAAAPAAVKEQPAREIRLRLELTNDSWVEVYDSQGERLFYDVATAGSVQSVSGRSPLRVVLGNAAGVSVAVDGQAREIPEGAGEGEGARFIVNRSGSLSRAR